MASELQVTRRVDALFKAFSSDFLLREQFVTDPAQILAEYVTGERLPAATAESANHLLYSVLSHPRLLAWVGDYSRADGGNPPSGQQFARDFAHAVAVSGDDQAVFSLVTGAGQAGDVFTSQSDLLRAVIGVLGRSVRPVATESTKNAGPFVKFNPESVGPTEFSPEPGPTEFSPEPGPTEFSPGPGPTEFSPGPGPTEFSPGPGGTEFSPGPVTELNTGTLEVLPPPPDDVDGPGRDLGASFSGLHVQQTIDALVQFSRQLRSAGALNPPAPR
jgi:hypothetical protein